MRIMLDFYEKVMTFAWKKSQQNKVLTLDKKILTIENLV